MTAARNEVSLWLTTGQEMGTTHVIVVTDTFSFESYPVYVMPYEDANEVFDDHNGKGLQRVEEVYDMSMDIGEQLKERKAFHLPQSVPPLSTKTGEV